ncbi:uncharacterized protein LOC111291374 isoform X1 [Durio zibethinus]|uniref:Uncharacterized protein LOC111291374 isoform X1 n=1 Tax=Durio zibethinus TaxID=66656 RepID=A0A6P5YEI5_DURZI|nr:uncharacterized protein LOC111291374 isoform X1 [Durio zibethinus]XP_022738797.1 uncharacterized protein LOC111291374 isoform X1 [Durio zibethinus]
MGDSTGGNKDKRHHEKVKKCHQEVENLICTIIGDCGYKQNRSWEKKMELVKQAKEKVLQWLRPIEAMQEAKVESQGIGAELKQMMAILDQKHQSMREAKVYTVVANMLQKVVNSCLSIAANDILIQEGPNQVQGHNGVGSDTFEIKGGQLRLNFPPTTDFFQINQKGKNAEVHNQEMIDQEKQVKELILTIGLVAGRLAELKLAMKKTSQEMDLEVDSTNEGFFDDLDDLLKHDSGFFDLDNFEKSLMDVTGTSNAAANKTNVMLSRDKTCFMENNIVLNCNASVVAEIFQEHPYVAENFLVDHPDSQSFFINSLAEVYRKIKSEPEMLELEGIKSMELKVKDMERVGLQLSWLKEMLAGVSESLEDKTERKRLLEEINSYEEKSNSYKDMAKEAKQKLAKLEKKPRFR